MNQPAVPVMHHCLAQRIVAIGLAWLMTVGALPVGAVSPSAISTPIRSASRAPYVALPSASTLPEEPATTPEPVPADETKNADKWGEITVGQPKIWQYERVNSLLDGLLRDVEGVSLTDLTGLDPNATNGAAVKFVQSMLEIGVKYDQAAATTNAIALQNYRSTLGIANEQLQANNTYLQTLYQERQSLTTQLLAATQLNSTLQTQVATTTATGDALAALKNQAAAANGTMTGLQQQLSAVNTQISTVSASLQLPPPPNIAATSAPTAPESPTTFSTFLGGLPSGIQQNLVNQLQSPSFPATKRLDNFITLLYERLAREISVLQDDVMRDSDNVPFLVQFDVGLYPASRASNHVGVVEFTMNCDGCKVYSIYPGQSSYNLANYEGASKRYSLWGALQTLFGFGISGAYRRQTDTLHGDLVQSVYMSGFQDGAPNIDRAGDKTKPTQRFGWYYGASPFETLVTPGVRSTFAIISIPRSILKNCIESDPANTSWLCGGGVEGRTDDLGTTKVMLNVTAHADWVRRDDPYFQKPGWWYLWFRKYAERAGNSTLTRNLKVVLPGTDGIKNIPNVVLRERDRLHVLGIEYNPVYFPVPKPPASPSGKPDSTTNTTPPSPGTTQASATGTGAGTTMVSVTGTGTVTATSTGSGGTTANASAVSPPAAKAGGGNDSSQTDSFTGCAKYQCAAVLLKLAEPIDPNLVVTVRGQPLRRVRDWRGRATSILPPVQSNSDITPPAAGATTGASATQPQRSENPSSRSLLEADQLSPNTWMEVDSHRLLLNISNDLAGYSGFPSIQIVDPAKRALFVPSDLDEGFTEIIMNEFHLPTRNEEQLAGYIRNHFRVPGAGKTTTSTKLRPAGPYAYETFLPLFLPQRDAQKVNAYLGETGIQLLIGFLDDSPDALDAMPHKWLASRAQVILEDSDLDLAWSLSCYAQDPNLVCDVPWQEVQSAYKIVSEICGGGVDCPSITKAWKDYPSISSLQVWVEQYDPEKEDSFYTPTPARLGQYPVAAAPGSGIAPDVGFSPWHFERADQKWVMLEGCRYPNFPPSDSAIRILGQHIPVEFRAQLVGAGPETGCFWFTIPTVALTHPEIVVEYPSNTPAISPLQLSFDPNSIPHKALSDQCSTTSPRAGICEPESLVAAWFQPYFGRPVIIPHPKPGKTLAIDSWTVEIPVGRVDCKDSLDVPYLAKLEAKWRIEPTGGQDVRIPGASAQRCPTTPDWQEASKTGQIRLVMEVTRENLDALLAQKQLHVIRGPNRTAIASLPDIRSLILPTKLAVVTIGKDQFELQGPGAESIDAVTLQGPGGVVDPPPTVATGAGIVLISLAQPSKVPASSGGGTKPAITKLFPESGKAGTPVKITGKGFGSGRGNVTFSDKPVTVSCWTDINIVVTVPMEAKPGKLDLAVMPAGAKTPIKLQKPFTVDEKGPDSEAAPLCEATAAPAPKAAPGPSAGTYTVLPLVSLGNGKYLPLEVTDPQGKPLTFSSPEKKSDSPTPPKGVEGPTTTLTFTKKETKTPAPPSDSEGTK